MPLTKNFIHRIEIIDGLLGYRRWTGPDLYAKVNEKLAEQGLSISKRTLNYDLNYLEVEKGAPLHRPKKSDPYYYYTEKYSIQNLPLDDEDVTYLTDAIHLLKQVNDFQVVQDVDAVIAKLTHRIHVNTVKAAPVVQFERQKLSAGNEYFDNLFTAIKEKITLKIAYQPFSEPTAKELLIHPYLLKEFRNRWFLFGRVGTEKKLTILALDRIKKVKNSGTPYIPNDLFDPEVYFDNLIGVSLPYEALPEDIEVKVFKEQAPYVLTKPIHRSQELVKKYKDGSLLIRLKLVINYELKSILLGYGSGIEVRKPETFREEFYALLAKMNSRYEKKKG